MFVRFALLVPCARIWASIVSTLLLASGVGLAQEKPQEQPAAAAQNTAPRLTEMEQRIEAALAQKVKWDFQDTPLKEIISQLTQQVDLPITLDEDDVEQQAIAADTPLTIDLGTASLRAGLELLSDQHHLGYFPTALGLRLASSETASESPVVRVYPVLDLVQRNPEENNGVVYDYDELIDAITSSQAPDSWVHSGGTGSIKVLDGSLASSQTLQNHYRIEQFLTAWREVRRDAMTRKSGEVGPIVSAHNTAPVREALGRPTSGTIEMELDRFANDVAKLAGVPVVLDSRGLDEAGLTRDKMIHATYRDAPLGDVLRDVLQPLGLAPAIGEEYVVITSEEIALKIGIETRFYPVYDLVDADLPDWQMPMGIWGIPMNDLDALIGVIVETVEADTWVDSGGMNSIARLSNPPIIAITATDRIHKGVERLLADHRANEAAAIVAEERKAKNSIVQKTYPLYQARRILQVKIALTQAEPRKPAEPIKPFVGSSSPTETSAAPNVGSGNVGGFGEQVLRNGVAGPIPSSESVAELIRELLPDPSWQEEGVLLRPFNDVLIVRQRPVMLRKIEKLLEEIDAWHQLHRAELFP
jgi:hypothetical protein